MTAADLLEWHDFFAVLAEVGSTLAGLLFVGLTISLGHVLHARGYLARVFGAFFLLFESVLIGLFGLLPNQSPFALGLEFVFVSLAVLAGTQAFARGFPEDHSTVMGSKRMHRFRIGLMLGGTLLPVIAGVSLCLKIPGALYWLMPAEMCCLYLSFSQAWIFAVEIPRRAGTKSDL
jgi:hypothetical protein